MVNTLRKNKDVLRFHETSQRKIKAFLAKNSIKKQTNHLVMIYETQGYFFKP